MGNAPYKIFQPEYDMPLSVDEPHYKKVVKNKDEMTGWERVQNLFEPDVYGEISAEIMNCKTAMLWSTFAGGFAGGIARSRTAYSDFFRSYAHEAFETPMRAKMLLQEKVLIAFGTGFYRVAWRLTLFTGMFMFTSTCATAYRGKYGVLDQAAGGAAAGFLYKLREGPKPAIAGGVVGAGLGSVAGFCMTSMFAIAGISYDTYVAYEYQRRAILNQKKLDEYHALRSDMGKKHSLSEFQDSLLQELSQSKASDVSKSSSNQVEPLKSNNSENIVSNVKESITKSKTELT